MQQKTADDGYWVDRKDSIYLYVVRQICRKYAQAARSVLDVGSRGTPVLEWQRDHARRLVSLDLVRPYVAPGVESLTCDFTTYAPDAKFDLVTCLQVLEHVPDPAPFARKLLETGRVVVVSVPYKWRAGSCAEHIHDPVDERKMLDWFGRPPDFDYLARELGGVRRLIHVYLNDRPAAAKTRSLNLDLLQRATAADQGGALFSIVRNERYFMPHFFRHYRSLGVSHFLIYDDHSVDGTREFLLAQPDCSVISSEHQFSDAFGSYPGGSPRNLSQLLKDVVPPTFFPGAWVITVDADEFLVLPPGFETLQSLTDALDARGQYYATAPMVDFYPGRLADRNYPETVSPFEACPYFDAGPLYEWKSGQLMPERLWRGIRPRLFSRLKAGEPALLREIFGQPNPKWWAKCWKVPLLRNGKGIKRMGDHEISVPPDTTLSVALAHFKFYPGMDAKIADALQRGQYYKGSQEYRFLDAAIRLLGQVSLLSDCTRRYEGPRSLVDAGLL